MSRSYRRLLAAALFIAGAPGAFAQAASCNITLTWPTWVGGNGFGASIDIRNTGAAITNGWTLVFNFPNGQQLQNGWPVNVTQSGTTVTAASNADWNKAIPTNGTFNVAFNGTFSGTNNPPTAFTLNGTACSIGGGTNPAPTVSLTSPTANQNFASGAAVPLAATASDSNGTIASVAFRVDGNVVNTDTSSPYSFSATGLAAGSHTVTATAYDNGNPTLSTATAAVPFTIGASGAVFRVNSAGRITKNGTVFPVRCGNWFGLEGRHEPSSDPTNPSGAPMEQYIGNTFWANGG